MFRLRTRKREEERERNRNSFSVFLFLDKCFYPEYHKRFYQRVSLLRIIYDK